jgi:hypothetical protein
MTTLREAWTFLLRALPMSIEQLFHKIVYEWDREHHAHMRRIANRYSLRAQMDGEVIKRTGEVVPKESV